MNERAVFARSLTIAARLKEAGYPECMAPVAGGERDLFLQPLGDGRMAFITIPETGPVMMKESLVYELDPQEGARVLSMDTVAEGFFLELDGDGSVRLTLIVENDEDILAAAERFRTAVKGYLPLVFQAVEDREKGISPGWLMYDALENLGIHTTVSRPGWWEMAFSTQAGDKWETLMCVTDDGMVHLDRILLEVPEGVDRGSVLELLNRKNGVLWMVKLVLTEEGDVTCMLDFQAPADPAAAGDTLAEMLRFLQEAEKELREELETLGNK